MLATFLIVPAEGGWLSSHLPYWETLSHLGGHPGCLLGRLSEPQRLEVQSAPADKLEDSLVSRETLYGDGIVEGRLPRHDSDTWIQLWAEILFFFFPLSHRYAWPS